MNTILYMLKMHSTSHLISSARIAVSCMTKSEQAIWARPFEHHHFGTHPLGAGTFGC